MNYEELHLGPNGQASQLQTIVESDGPATVVLKNDGDQEYMLAMVRGSATRAVAPTDRYQVTGETQEVVNPPDGAETDFIGHFFGNTPNPHPVLENGTDGVCSAAATRTLTSAGSTFLTNGVKAGDILMVNEGAAGVDDGTYRIVQVNSETVLTIDRDWPDAGPVAAQDFWVYGRCAIAPKSVTFTLTIGAATITVTDDGAGVLYGQIAAGPPITAVNGTINYFTGRWTLVCDTAPDNATNIVAAYAESLPVVAGGKISYPISNLRRAEPVKFYGIGNGDNVRCKVSVFTG